MTIGPGKYDWETTKLRERLEAKGIILIVLEGNKGSGFSGQMTAEAAAQMPDLLEDVARQMREDFKGGEPV